MPRRHSPLGAFLTARRTACAPADVGIAPDARRRVAGLRRDEVANLAGISLEYYVRLEQGRVTRPSDQVTAALARALRMDAVHTDYLHRLARGGTTPARPVTPQTTESLRVLLAQWSASPAYVTDSALDILAANDAMVALSGGDLIPGRNALLRTFLPEARESIDDWERVARDAIAAFRFHADPGSARVREILDQLADDPDFPRLWALHEVAQPSTFHLRARAGELGEIEFGVQNFTPPAHPGCLVTLYFAAPGSVAAEVFARLVRPAAVAA